MGVRASVAVLSCAIAAATAPAAAAEDFAPKDGHAFHGVSDTGHVGAFREFSHQVGAHQALLQDFFYWRVPLTTGALYRWGATNTRGVLSLSTATGAGEEKITPAVVNSHRLVPLVLRA